MPNGPEEQASRFCEAVTAELMPLESRLLGELFVYCQTGNEGQVFELSRQLEELYSARKPFGTLTRWVDQVHEPLIRRRVASLRQRFLEFQGDREAQKKLDHKIGDFLREAGSPQTRMLPYRHPLDCADRGWPVLHDAHRERRQEQFLEKARASKRQAELLAEIFALRTRLDEERTSERAQEFDPEQHIQEAVETALPIPQLLANLRLETDGPYEEVMTQRANRLGVSSLAWWDLLYEPSGLSEPLSSGHPDEPVSLMRQTLESIGFDLNAIGITVHAETLRQGQPQQAFRFPVQVPGDVRVLVRHEPGLRGVDLLLHEMGHALYTSQIEQGAWEFRSPAGTAFTEAIGQLFARFCRQPEWLTGLAGLDPARAEWLRGLLVEQDLVRLRLGLLLARFEELARGRNVAELESLWRELVQSILRIDPGEPGLYTWATVRQFVLHPGQSENLVLAELVSAQLWGHYCRHLGPLVENEALGRRLARDVFRHGSRYPWPQLLLKITGRELSVESMAKLIIEDCSV